MEKSLFTLVLAFVAALLFGCQTNDNIKAAVTQSTEVTSDEKEIAKREISGRIDEIINGAKALDVDAAIKPYLADTSFRAVGPDGSIADYQTMKNVQTEFFKTVRNMSFSTVSEDFKFLSKDLVLYTWNGRNEFEMKTGEKMKIEPYVGSMLFNKRGDEWKIMYAHESSGQPVKVEVK